MTKEGANNTAQNERLMVSVRVRPVEPFRDTNRAVAVINSQTLLFSEPPPVDRSDPEHHYRSGTTFPGVLNTGNSSLNNPASTNSTTTTATTNRANSNKAGNLNNNNNNNSSHIPQSRHNGNGGGGGGGGPGTVEVGKAYDFDWVFDENASQEEVYKNTAAPLVRSVLEGFCATVFAYGATGSGKTYTMIGTATNPGIMARAVDDIFQLCANQKKELDTEVSLSYLEVYNEQIRDLLRPSGIHLDLREDKDHVHVAGLSEVRATTTHEVLNLLQKGNRARTMEATAANVTSSRSHAVLQVTVRQVSQRTGLITEGKLYLIDLAGSERASNTKNSGVRLREGGHINRSLLALGNCITALASGDGDKYINYRDSKLTRLLKAALGGPSKTAMIAHVSPGVQQREETRNTLLYARRARAISNRVRKFTYHGQATDTNYVIQELRNEVKRLQLKLEQRSTPSPPSQPPTDPLLNSAGSNDDGASPPYSMTHTPPSPPSPPVAVPVTSHPHPHTHNAHTHSTMAMTPTMRTNSQVEDFLGKRDRLDLSGMKQEIVQLFDEEFRLRNDLLKLDGAMLQSALDCEILRLMVLDWETLKIQRDSDGEATGSDSDHGKTEISSVMAELKQVRQEQDRLLQMRTNVENQLKGTRGKISQTEEDATQYLPDVQREILSLLCKLQQEQVQKMSIEIEAELKRRGSLLLRCLRQKALGEAIIHRQRHFLNAIAGNPPKTGETGSSGGSGQSFFPPLAKPMSTGTMFHTPPNPRSTRGNHLPPLSSGIPKTTKYSEFRKGRALRRESSSDDEGPAKEPPKMNLGRKHRVNSPDLRYKPPY